MNREIKFRTWDTYSGIMHRNVIFATGHVVKIDNGTNWIPHTSINGEVCTNVMQFTGLKDMEGNPIYEGDILSNKHVHGVEDEDFCQVKFAGGGFMAIYEFMSLDLHEDSDDLKIVGNIYENPELCTK